MGWIIPPQRAVLLRVNRPHKINSEKRQRITIPLVFLPNKEIKVVTDAIYAKPVFTKPLEIMMAIPYHQIRELEKPLKASFNCCWRVIIRHAVSEPKVIAKNSKSADWQGPCNEWRRRYRQIKQQMQHDRHASGTGTTNQSKKIVAMEIRPWNTRISAIFIMHPKFRSFLPKNNKESLRLYYPIHSVNKRVTHITKNKSRERNKAKKKTHK